MCKFEFNKRFRARLKREIHIKNAFSKATSCCQNKRLKPYKTQCERENFSV